MIQRTPLVPAVAPPSPPPMPSSGRAWSSADTISCSEARAISDTMSVAVGLVYAPPVNRLQDVFAERTGKEAALFVPSGTMANQIALRVLAPAGSMVVAGRRQHVVTHEGGAFGVNQSAQLHVVDDPDGTLDPGDVAELVAGGGHPPPGPGGGWGGKNHPAAGGPP